jgi:hypothetical protein
MLWLYKLDDFGAGETDIFVLSVSARCGLAKSSSECCSLITILERSFSLSRSIVSLPGNATRSGFSKKRTHGDMPKCVQQNCEYTKDTSVRK